MSTLVVALNPSIDVEWKVDDVRWEEKNVIQVERRWPGGKGVNVARWMRFLGADSTLIVPFGGATGEELYSGLRREKIRLKAVHIKEATRANVIVTTPLGRQLRFNPAGPKLTDYERNEIFRVIRQRSRRSSTIVLSGSLPRSGNPALYKQILNQNPLSRVLLDCDGEAFAKSIPGKPFLVKPNEFELAEWAGQRLPNEKTVIDAAHKLSLRTGHWVFVSRGKAGAVLLNAQLKRCWIAKSPKADVKNTVGAGDALLAAVATQIDSGAEPESWVRSGVATGCAAVSCEAGTLPKTSLIRKFAALVQVVEKRL